MIEGWKYYNHAAISTSLPGEPVDLSALTDGRLWSIDGKRPLLAKWETDWDCAHDTGWWWEIKESPFDWADLNSKSRTKLRQALKKCRVERISPLERESELWACFQAAFAKYKMAANAKTRFQFHEECARAVDNGIDFWGGFDIETGQLIGFLTIQDHGNHVENLVAKFDPAHLKSRVSDALYATVLDEYLNKRHKRFLSCGRRSINHVTNTQAYREEHFKFRKAYCRLHIVYAPRIRWLMRLLYPFRRLIWRLSEHDKKLHLLGAVLKMDEIARGEEIMPPSNLSNDKIDDNASNRVSDV